MSDILDKILNDQSNNVTSNAVPKNNELEELNKRLIANMNPSIYNNNSTNNTSLQSNNPTTSDESSLKKEYSINPNTYEAILTEIQEHEIGMQQAIQEADELAVATKQGVMDVLKISNNRRHGILIQGVPDALNAAAKLLDLSINGRYKLASMKKLRASIIKDMNSNNAKSDEFDLMKLLSESDSEE